MKNRGFYSFTSHTLSPLVLHLLLPLSPWPRLLLSSSQKFKCFQFSLPLSFRWSSIAAQLSGRTDNDIKNYWNSHLSRRVCPIRKPDAEENVIKLTNASTPRKRRAGKASRATVQKSKTNNLVNNKDDVDPISSNNINSQLSPALDENFMFNPEQELSIEDMMGLDELLLTTREDCFIGSDVSPNVSNPKGSEGGGLTSSSSSAELSCVEGGISRDMEIGMVKEVGWGFQWCIDEKEQLSCGLWENEDYYWGGEPLLSDVAADLYSAKEQGMAAWLLW